MKIFSVYDDKAEAFLQPFFSPTEGSALRSFHQAASEEGHQFNIHAADYNLFQIGDFSEDTGAIYACEPIKNLGNALTIKSIKTEE